LRVSGAIVEDRGTDLSVRPSRALSATVFFDAIDKALATTSLREHHPSPVREGEEELGQRRCNLRRDGGDKCLEERT